MRGTFPGLAVLAMAAALAAQDAPVRKGPAATDVLLGCVKAKDRRTGRFAIKTLISAGDEKTIPALVAAIQTCGDKELASWYARSGKRELADAARAWAERARAERPGAYSPRFDPQWGRPFKWMRR